MALRRGRGERPLYAQVAQQLRAPIDAGELRPGDRLDSEPALVRRLGVSRATVAKALDLLESEGLVVREQGRGTFVRSAPLVRPLQELTGFTEHVHGLGRRPGQRFLGSESVEAAADDPLLAPFPDGAPLVVLRRLRMVDDEPAGVHRTALPAELADRLGLDEHRLRARGLSLYSLFGEHGVGLAAATEHLRARTADDQEAELLRLRPGAALLQVLRFSRDTAGALVEAVDARYVAALYDYRIDLVRTPATHDDLFAEEGAHR